MSGSFDSIYRPDLFEGQVVLITGGGTGIGRCTAHELASLGATVVISGRREDVLEGTAKEIAEAGGRCETAPFDIREEEAIEFAVAGIVERHGRIDHVVNNAGGQFVQPTEQLSPKGWRSVIELILNGSYFVTHAAYRHSLKEHGGSVVFMLADIWTGYPWMAHMSAARAGLQNLAMTLALEWAAQDIRVNCIAPGTILSSGMHHYPPEVQNQAVKGSRHSPASRLGSESEVSSAIVFLLSPGAYYVTGETLRVDGGASHQKGRFFPIGKHAGARVYDGFHLGQDFTGTPFEGHFDVNDPEKR